MRRQSNTDRNLQKLCSRFVPQSADAVRTWKTRFGGKFIASLWFLAWYAPITGADWNGFANFRATAEAWLEADALSVNLRIKQSAVLEMARQLGVSVDDPGGIAMRLLSFHDDTDKLLKPRTISVRHVTPHAFETENDAYVAVELGIELTEETKTLAIVPSAAPAAQKALGLVFLHKGIPVADRFTLDKRVRLSLDWTDPWQSRFDDGALARRHAEPQTFIYVESHTVRQESVLRLNELAPLLKLGLKDPRYIEPNERSMIERKVGRFVTDRVNLLVNGRKLPRQIDRIEFLAFGAEGLLPVDGAERVEAITAVVGVSQSYLTDTPVEALSLTWGIFPAGIDNRAISVILNHETFDGYATRHQPRYDWSNSEALAVDAEPQRELVPGNPTQLKELVDPLLENIYRAFQLHDEETVYDRLAESLDGDLLDSVYLQHCHAALLRSRGLSGEGRIERVDVYEASPVTDSSHDEPEIRVRWAAHGLVSHWGHAHMRDNVYEAMLKLRKDQKATWKIAGLHFINAQGMQPFTNR